MLKGYIFLCALGLRGFCDHANSVRPIAVQYMSFASVMWKLKLLSTNTLRID